MHRSSVRLTEMAVGCRKKTLACVSTVNVMGMLSRSALSL